MITKMMSLFRMMNGVTNRIRDKIHGDSFNTSLLVISPWTESKITFLSIVGKILNFHWARALINGHWMPLDNSIVIDPCGAFTTLFKAFICAVIGKIQ